ncbi:VPLPA-CTERM sorting domain-containing protein [Sulfurirhabdus autotrophica]|uniref:Putative secreted protein n=1 Tax=Sulfurirhabdus autotrophica TaxID=1706046 RepID=A0A4R3Y4T4_9PROT|nr:VPLPA-CTERM sorting domain-containing protein [Sulfurirhabdus autotrophica]TCV86727.1 putative secreted protein [Sulfurirhabdus autotrophica]
MIDAQIKRCCLPKMKYLVMAIVLLGSTSANAAIVDQVAGLTTFVTTGADMTGMTVHAYFENGIDQLQAWSSYGGTSGGVAGTSWGLSVTGDTYVNEWSFTNTTGSKLTKLELDGTNGSTVFDTDFGGLVGTSNSSFGGDFWSVTSGYTYSYANAVGIGGAAPVGDIYHKLNVNFASGIAGNWTFAQDTDTVSAVPVPAAVWLLGSGLLGMAGFARKSS